MQTQSTKVEVAASVLAARITDIQGSMAQVANACDLIHIDIMDGSFVPAISFGQSMVSGIRQLTDKPLDVHLMIRNPERHIESFAKAGANCLTIHAETTHHLHRLLGEIKEAGMQAGVALNPSTSLYVLEYVWDVVDVVLLMSVNPGKGGQHFIPSTYEKLHILRHMRDASEMHTRLEVDGGINLQTAPALIEAGAQILVVGSALFGADDPASFTKQIRA